MDCPICMGAGRLRHAGSKGNLGLDTPYTITCWGCQGAGKIAGEPIDVTVSLVKNIVDATVEPAIKDPLLKDAVCPDCLGLCKRENCTKKADDIDKKLRQL